MRQDIRSQRKKIVAANLPLTEAEAVKFCPVFDRYVVEHSKIYDTRYALIKEYAQNYDKMTTEQANGFMRGWTAIEEQMAELRFEVDARIREGDLPPKNRDVLLDRPAPRLYGRTATVIPDSFG